MKIHHIGYLCKDIEKTIKLFLQLGYECKSDIIIDSIPNEDNVARNVSICFMRNCETLIELVCPINKDSDVHNTIVRQGEGPYHICYQVSDIEKSLAEFNTSGWIIIKKPAKAIALNNSKVAFLFKRGVGIIELVEMEQNG